MPVCFLEALSTKILSNQLTTAVVVHRLQALGASSQVLHRPQAL